MDEVDPVDAAGTAAAGAAADLARVREKVAAARAVLAKLLQEVVRAEGRLDDDRAAQLLAANEQLVLSALHDQTLAAQATQVLARVAHAAERDALTQLPNRVLLIDRFARALTVARRRGGRVGLLFLDLDNFKHVNDTLGHAVGDGVLKDVAHRLVKAVREADTVSRHGGDEFLVLLTDITQHDDAARIADKLLRVLADSRDACGTLHPLQASIGISIYPDDGDDIDLLIHRADLAMYRAKREGGAGWAFHRKVTPPG